MQSTIRCGSYADYVFAHAPTVLNYTLNMTYFVCQVGPRVAGTQYRKASIRRGRWILWRSCYVGRDINIDELTKTLFTSG